jgi:uncharacterized OB-fold protein
MNPQQSALANSAESKKKPLHDFERAEPRPRIRMMVCGRCGRWATPSEIIETPCLKDGTPHHFEPLWYRVDENQGWE